MPKQKSRRHTSQKTPFEIKRRQTRRKYLRERSRREREERQQESMNLGEPTNLGEPIILGEPMNLGEFGPESLISIIKSQVRSKAVSFPISQEMLNNWVPFHPVCDLHNTDCVASSLAFLDVIPRNVYERASAILNTTRSAVSEQEIITMLPRFEFYENNANIIDFESMKKIIPKSSGTIVFILNVNPRNLGHAVILAHNNNDNIVIIDSQKQKIIQQPEIESWLARSWLSNIAIIPMKAPELLGGSNKKNKKNKQ
jgi:hypothetical protein